MAELIIVSCFRDPGRLPDLGATRAGNETALRGYRIYNDQSFIAAAYEAVLLQKQLVLLSRNETAAAPNAGDTNSLSSSITNYTKTLFLKTNVYFLLYGFCSTYRPLF